MRYDHTITFWHSKNIYNPDTGKTVESVTFITAIAANVTDLGTDRTQQIFGSININAKVARIRTAPPADWSYTTIGENPQRYHLMTSKSLLKGYTLILGEDVSANA